MTDEVELLSQGKEPTTPPSELSRAARSVLTAAVVAALVVAAALLSHTTRPPADAARETIIKPSFTRPPPLAPRLHQVRVSTTGQRAEVTSRGHVDLDLQLVNDGSFPLALLNVRMPQPGVRSDPGPGGLVSSPAIAHLAPEIPTPVTVHLVVLCPQGLSGVAADHLELTLLDDRGATRSTLLDLRSLPGFWDHVRHSACSASVAGLVVDSMPTSVRWEDGTS